MRAANTFVAASVVLVLLCTSSVSAAALILSALQARDQFARCGYEIGNPDLTVTARYVVVRDSSYGWSKDADRRIVMAIVYASPRAALDAHRKAHHQAEDRLGEHFAFSNNHGPQMLNGYSGSVWRGNVALVQSSTRTLASMWTEDAETGDAFAARPELMELGFDHRLAEFSVDRDFVACLDDIVAPEALTAELLDDIPTLVPGSPF
jgi:hypothetical protein